ncbi:TPA: DUF429 domain-containing protein [Candidatus Bathyarchaeota archaeon]|nr:DUF429 domain-containing protein [Candidatus Bathyarchaeota archaeon]
MKIAGVDLAGVEARPTGFCALNDKLEARTSLLHSDEEILRSIEDLGPKVVSIDAPLALPRGRCCLRNACSCRGGGHLRECDRQLLKMGVKFFPVTLGPMRKLTLRGLKLRALIERRGFRVIETYPGAAQDLLGIPRKKAGIEPLRAGLVNCGVKGDVLKEGITHHELDAITCALVGEMYLNGDYLALGDPNEILMILPRPRAIPSNRRR